MHHITYSKCFLFNYPDIIRELICKILREKGFLKVALFLLVGDFTNKLQILFLVAILFVGCSQSQQQTTGEATTPAPAKSEAKEALIYQVENTPEGVAKAYYRYIGLKQYDKAYTLLTKENKASYSLEKFTELIKDKRDFWGFENMRASVFDELSATNEGKGTFENSVSVKVTHKVWGYKLGLFLVNEDGNWRIIYIK